MTDFDLDRLGDVWRQQPDPKELESLRRAAESMRRRARWAQFIDVVSAIAVAGVVLFLALSNPHKGTFLVGGGAILLLLLSQMRQRRLRHEELKGLTGTAEEMLDQSITRVEATIRRTVFSLFALPPCVVLGLVFSYFADNGAGVELLRPISADPWVGKLLLPAGAASLVVGALYLIWTIRRSKRELDRLTAMRNAYREERGHNITE